MIPQIDFPFRLDARGQIVVVEQDTVEEVAASVAVILSTTPGTRLERPEFGSGDLAFRGAGGIREAILAANDHDPRAQIHIDDERLVDDVTLRLRVEVTE